MHRGYIFCAVSTYNTPMDEYATVVISAVEHDNRIKR